MAPRVRALRPDWLLVPFARRFDDGLATETRWLEEEHQDYVQRVWHLGVGNVVCGQHDLPRAGATPAADNKTAPEGADDLRDI